jgi:hypothetical protein
MNHLILGMLFLLVTKANLYVINYAPTLLRIFWMDLFRIAGVPVETRTKNLLLQFELTCGYSGFCDLFVPGV